MFASSNGAKRFSRMFSKSVNPCAEISTTTGWAPVVSTARRTCGIACNACSNSFIFRRSNEPRTNPRAEKPSSSGFTIA